MPNTIDGVPFLFDDSSDNQLFGQLFPNGLAPPNIQGNFGATANPNPYQSPFGEESLFHFYPDIEEGLNQSIDVSDGYTYKFIPLVSGVAVFEKYNSQAPEDLPSSKQLFIYYEKGENTSLDFFGTACRVKFGTEQKLLMEKLSSRKTVIRLGDREVRTLSEWSSVVAKRLKIEIDVLLRAVKLELSGLLNDKTIFKQLLGLNNDLAKWIYAGANKMEEWKFTAKNYEYGKWRAGTQKEYEPIIPVLFETRAKDFLTTNNRDTHKVKDKGFDNLVNFINNFDSVLFNPQVITQLIPGMADDTVVLFARFIYQDKLPDNVRQLLTKVKAIVNQAKVFINTIKEKINTNTALFNALLCGIINGLISLLQLVVLIIGYIIDNFALLEVEKPFSREEFDKSGQRLEFVEDLIEMLSERSEKIFNGLLLNFITASTQFVALVDSIYKKLKNVSRYFIAFILGAIVFEVIFDSIIAFFTGGTSLAVSLASKISRASTKAAQAGIKLAKQVGKKVVASTTDILRFLRAEFDELIQAIINGRFLKYIEEKISDFLELGEKVAKNVIGDIKKFFRDFDPEDLDWMHRRHRVGSLGGKVLTTRQIRVLRKLLKEKYGVDLIFEGSSNVKSLFKPIGNFKNPKQLFEYMSSFHTPKVGVFDSKTAQMVLPKNTTEIIAFHELAHVKHWKSVGDDMYQTINTLDREMNVWEQVFKNKNRWTKEELEDALRYINDIRVSPRYGFEIEPLNIKI